MAPSGYKRVLGVIWDGQVNVNVLMVAMGYAEVFRGAASNPVPGVDAGRAGGAVWEGGNAGVGAVRKPAGVHAADAPGELVSSR